VTSGKGTVSTNVADYAKKDLQVAFANASVTTSVLLELIANRKTVLGALHWHADHEKMGMTEGELQQAHAVLDAKRLMLVNRTVVRSLHDAVFPDASERRQPLSSFGSLERIFRRTAVTHRAQKANSRR
jgi:hypothetical protein